MSEFIDNYEPERNDVVYGLASPRDNYLDAYVEWWLQRNWKDPLRGDTIYKKDPLTRQNVGEPTSTPQSRKKTRRNQLLKRRRRPRSTTTTSPSRTYASTNWTIRCSLPS